MAEYSFYSNSSKQATWNMYVFICIIHEAVGIVAALLSCCAELLTQTCAICKPYWERVEATPYQHKSRFLKLLLNSYVNLSLTGLTAYLHLIHMQVLRIPSVTFTPQISFKLMPPSFVISPYITPAKMRIKSEIAIDQKTRWDVRHW